MLKRVLFLSLSFLTVTTFLPTFSQAGSIRFRTIDGENLLIWKSTAGGVSHIYLAECENKEYEIAHDCEEKTDPKDPRRLYSYVPYNFLLRSIAEHYKLLSSVELSQLKQIDLKELMDEKKRFLKDYVESMDEKDLRNDMEYLQIKIPLEYLEENILPVIKILKTDSKEDYAEIFLGSGRNGLGEHLLFHIKESSKELILTDRNAQRKPKEKELDWFRDVFDSEWKILSPKYLDYRKDLFVKTIKYQVGELIPVYEITEFKDVRLSSKPYVLKNPEVFVDIQKDEYRGINLIFRDENIR